MRARRLAATAHESNVQSCCRGAGNVMLETVSRIQDLIGSEVHAPQRLAEDLAPAGHTMTDPHVTRLGTSLDVAVPNRILRSAYGGTAAAEVDTVLSDLDWGAPAVRLRITGAPAETVIVKYPRTGSYEQVAATVRNEAAALQLLGEMAVEPPIAPRLVGWDPPTGIRVLEDLGNHGTDEYLFSDDPEPARRHLIAHAHTLGTLHARTRPSLTRFRELAGANTYDRMPRLDEHLGYLHAMLPAVGVAIGPHVQRELDEIAQLIREPRLVALTHGDPCPGNDRLVGTNVTLIDYYWSYPRHPLFDGAAHWMAFPTYGRARRIPPDIADHAQTSYRHALSAGFPELSDDETFHTDLALACGYWMIGSLTWDLARTLWWRRRAETSDAQELALYGNRFVAVSESLHRLPALAGLTRTVLERLGLQEIDMPEYPAFRSR